MGYILSIVVGFCFYIIAIKCSFLVSVIIFALFLVGCIISWLGIFNPVLLLALATTGRGGGRLGALLMMLYSTIGWAIGTFLVHKDTALHALGVVINFLTP